MNRTDLRGALVAAGVPDDLYSLQGVHELPSSLETCYLLGGSDHDVRVGVVERGGARFGFSGTEDEACEFLLHELVFDEPEPVEFDDADDAAAARRSAELNRLVNAALDEGARLAPVVSVRFHLRPGDVVDRFGPESGTFLYPDGTPLERRALPPTAFEAGYFRYTVTGDIPVQAGVAGPAFEQPGGTAMFKLDPSALAAPPPLMTVRWLVHEGLLRPIVERSSSRAPA